MSNPTGRHGRGVGRVYRPKNRKVWMLAYYIGPPDARRRIRESAKTTDEEIARKRLERRLRKAANAAEGIAASRSHRTAA